MILARNKWDNLTFYFTCFKKNMMSLVRYALFVVADTFTSLHSLFFYGTGPILHLYDICPRPSRP